MTNTGIRLAVAGVAFYLAAGGTAEAAKGVEKVAAANNPANAPANNPANVPANALGNAAGNTQRMITGIVLSVNHKNGSASFHLRTAHQHKKNGIVNAAAAAGGNQQNHSYMFNVTAATRFGHQNGAPASLASLHRGERVRVQAVGHQAVNVLIASQNRTRGTFTRYRTNNYRPQLVQQHPHRRR